MECTSRTCKYAFILCIILCNVDTYTDTDTDTNLWLGTLLCEYMYVCMYTYIYTYLCIYVLRVLGYDVWCGRHKLKCIVLVILLYWRKGYNTFTSASVHTHVSLPLKSFYGNRESVNSVQETLSASGHPSTFSP